MLTQINKIFLLKINKVDDEKSILQLSDTVKEALKNLKIVIVDSNVLSDLMIVTFMLTKLKQRYEFTLQY